MRIVLTGANGFVGTSLLKRILGAGHSVVTPLRRRIYDLDRLVHQELVIGLDEEQDWQSILNRQQLVHFNGAMGQADL